MKIAMINGGVFGSTGKIMFGIADIIEKNGGETFCASAVTATNKKREPSHEYYKIGTYYSRKFSVLFSRITGRQNCYAKSATKKLLSRLDRFNPDVVHLHNLHGDYVNLPLLFNYIKTNRIKVVWTLHDCWAFTGHCPHFAMVKCDKWKSGCYKCPQYNLYPKSLFDNSKKMYRLKKRLFTGVENMTIVTPSEWLAGLVRQSFLKDYPVTVINNGINLSVFKPTESDFREKYDISADKKILLGVAFGWGVRKGLDVFIELYNRLSAEKYQIVLVGTDKKTDKQLPKGIISIHRTQNQTELAEIYTAADLFVNPTREEVLGMVNIEANACGTPVITFKTGGSPECINEQSGSVVACDDIAALESEVKRICETSPFNKEDCIESAKKFDENERFLEYIHLYEELNGKN